MILTGKNRRTRRETCPSATLSTTNPTWIDPGANLGLHGERPATNDLSHGTATFWDVLPCSQTHVDRRFRGACCLHHQGAHGRSSPSQMSLLTNSYSYLKQLLLFTLIWFMYEFSKKHTAEQQDFVNCEPEFEECITLSQLVTTL
jgi:hypothetical protein